MKVTDIFQTFYPFYDYRKREVYPSLALVYLVEDTISAAHGGKHTVVRAWNPRKKEVMTWCGDQFLEGMLDHDKAANRMLEFLGNINGARMALEQEWRASLDRGADGECDFWELHKTGAACKHVQFIVEHEPANGLGGIFTGLAELATAANVNLVDLDLMQGRVISQLRDVWGLDGGDIDAECGDDSSDAISSVSAWHLTPQGVIDKLAFRSPVLLEGDKGAGKTTLARSLAESHGAVLIEVQGNESLEAADLLGHFVPAQNGLVWKDGKLSQAFRMAGAGRKVVLLLDELLRIPQRQLSVLLGALSPYQGRYSLSTGRMADVVDGIGVEEALHCPVENLAVVATTNVGMQYAIDNIDPALADRFVPVRMETSHQTALSVLREVCRVKSFKITVASRLARFMAKTQELRDNRQLTDCPSLRVLVRCVENADSEADVAHLLRAHHLLWVARGANGQPDAGELAMLEKMTERIFKEKGTE